ncbi:membrane protease subunit, stomatin/prohibitin [Candidatus Nitrososphaera evergladensis SR1]|jgi:regulator of protease activity HflC (stomatin/prohibitin superfamily)|uniref:Membrane protease subunit, stomatin/prohibitin n=1 Tax=Candidatus Nitrososphaera evergladensis SR1 TaxID=1459636 RepID=A0A075MUG6_9ARCH|nr:SPFH domain-containing protein [Candidatus Nitrososphaera evergladensis]AIF84850.1 membrane protease subunit, stomatin/prohibitin [Candidatus Nitrososphaera evergladensis SR1]
MSTRTFLNFDRLVSQKGSGSQAIAGVVILIVGLAVANVIGSAALAYVVAIIGVAVIISAFLMIIKQYERAVILRLGRFQRQVGPGVQIRIPFADNILVIDVREKVREFTAERMLTKDNVPVTIDAILRYRIIEDRARDAILNVENFNDMIQQVSQTTLRNNIGASYFQDILSKREEVNKHIKEVIAEESRSWGIEVRGVEIRQVAIPKELEDAMSMQAQAEREKNARVTYGESEVLVAKQFEEAAKVYTDNPVAYALRQSNMLYESIKVQGNTIVMVPSESLNSIGFGNLALTQAYLDNIKSVAAAKAATAVADDKSGSEGEKKS